MHALDLASPAPYDADSARPLQHVVFGLKFIIMAAVPDVPEDIRIQVSFLFLSEPPEATPI